MQNKKYKYISGLVPVLAITFLLVFLLKVGINNTNAEEESLTIPSSIQYELNEGVDGSSQSIPIKASLWDVPDIGGAYQSTLELNLRLAGTVLVGNEYTYALIVEETTGRQNLYSVGESVKGAKLLKIDKESILIEKDGKSHILKVTGGSYTETPFTEILSGDGPPTIGVSAELPFFEPVFSETGPYVDGNVLVEELPPFEPITNNTGPPVDPEGFYKDLPEFEPFESDSGP